MNRIFKLTWLAAMLAGVFALAPQRAHAFILISANGSQCLDLQNGVPTNPAVVQTYGCSANNNQQWTWQGYSLIGPGSTQVSASTTNLRCLDLAGGSTAPGTQVVLNACNGAASQEWLFANGQIINNATRYCLTLTSTVQGELPVIRPCGGVNGSRQNWYIRS